uniref:Uncharacterized protein n=1 Tax=Meloidogyne hapla TaxID=6305 RepID=A0A1I8AWY0_MELHA
MFSFWVFSLFFITSVSTFSPVRQIKKEIFIPFEEKRSSPSSYDFVRFGRNSFKIDGKTNKKSNGNNGNTYDYIRFG